MTMNPEPEYPPGPFTIGVGGVVIKDGKALLVKLTYGHKGWILPGGYVKSTETIGRAVRREVYEETGLEVQPSEIISVRSRVNQGKCDVYVAFLTKVTGGELRPDSEEVSDVKYFALSDMETREDVPRLNTLIVKRALERVAPRFSLSDYNQTPEQLYELWL